MVASATASAGRQRERQRQPSQQEHAEVSGGNATAADVGKPVSARPEWRALDDVDVNLAAERRLRCLRGALMHM